MKPFGFGVGFQKARRVTAARLNRDVTQAVMATLVTEELKRLGAKRANGELVTVSQSAWSDYEAERSEPGLIVVRATSRVSGISEPEILFPSPTEPIDASQLRYLTDEEIARAEKKVAESTPNRGAAEKGARKRRA